MSVRVMRRFALTLVLCSLFAPPALAQVVVVEEGEVPEEQVVERGYVRGEGRGVQYGAHLISPVYVTSVQAEGTPLRVDAGLGIQARIGWEFPSGFTIEVQGGLAVNAVPEADLEMSNAFTRGEVGVAARYMFFNDTAFVPFIEVGGALRWFFFDWRTGPGEEGVQTAGERENLTGAVKGAVGAQIELSPYFGIELGCAVDYTFAGAIFTDGIVSVTPFVGVTLYVYDESGN
jgi:hypothetical protein